MHGNDDNYYNRQQNNNEETLTSHQNSERETIFKGAPFSVYKQKAALQFKLVLQNNRSKKISQTGSVILEMAKCVGKSGKFNTYDWKKKITVKLLPIEISKLSQALINQVEVSFVHNVSFSRGHDTASGDVYKKINLKKGEKGSMFIAVSFQSNNIFVPLDRQEAILLATLLRSTVPVLYGWV